MVTGRLSCLARIEIRAAMTGWIAAFYGALYVHATADFRLTESAWIFGGPFVALLTIATGVHLVLSGVGGRWLPSPVGWVNTINEVLRPEGQPELEPRERLEEALRWLPFVPAADALCALALGSAVAVAMAGIEWSVSGSSRNVSPVLVGGLIATLLYGALTFTVCELLVGRPCWRLRLAAIHRTLDAYSGPTVPTWMRMASFGAPTALALMVAQRIAVHRQDSWLALSLTLVLGTALCTGLAWLHAIALRNAAADLGYAARRLTSREGARMVTGALDAQLVEMARVFNTAADHVDRSQQIAAARYSALFEGAGDAILLVDRVTDHVLEANRRALELTGMSEVALKSMRFESLFRFGARLMSVNDLQPGGRRCQSGARVIRVDGSECPVDVALSVVEVGDHSVVQAILHDVSERERIESELRVSVERLEGLYHLAVTLGGTVEQVADHMASTLAELLAVPLVAIERHEGDELVMLAMYEDGMLTRGQRMRLADTPCARVHEERQACVYTDATRAFPKDAFLVERGIMTYVGVPVFGRKGEVAGLVAVMDSDPRHLGEADMRLLWTFAERLARAFHEQEYAREREAFVEQLTAQNAELRMIQERLTESDRLKSEFMGMMSHELRTPLNIFIGYTELLLDVVREGRPEEGGEHRDVLLRMLDASRTLTTLVEDTLSVLRLESAGVRVNLEPVTLPAFFEELRAVERFMRPRLAVEERWVVEADLPEIVSDRLKLRQILTNLVGNARKFTAAGTITVEARRAGTDAVAISVEDTGCGIAAAELPFVFDLYRQAPNGESRNGCGIGLYIVRRYCELLGGAVTATSELGRGTRFVVTLPCRAVVRVEGRPAA